jgi:hypothetical protein
MNLKLLDADVSTVQKVRSGAAGTTPESPIDAVVIGAGPSGA